MPDILIPENIRGPALTELESRFSCVCEPELWRQPERIIEMLPDYRALIVRNQTRVTRELIEAAERLAVIGRTGVGLDNVDVEAASERGIVVAFTPEQNTNSVAELTIGLMLSLARTIPAADRDTREGNWNRHRFTGIEITGKTLGLFGLGRIGLCTAAKARALGMDIIAFDPFIDPEGLAVLQLRARLCSAEEVLADADFISCHLPANRATQGYFTWERFRQMKPGAFFINTSRGDVVDEEALLRALTEGRIAGAALDVRAQEPPGTNPFADLDNVILLPHIGAFTAEGQRRVLNSICHDVAAVLDGKSARNFANFARPVRHTD